MTQQGAASGGVEWALDDEGIGWLTFHPAAGRPPLVGSALLQGIEAALDQLTAARGLVFRSSVPGAFLAGADLSELLALPDPAAATARAVDAQRVLRRVETLEIPTVSAIGGACIGAGVEVALACAYRLAADDRSTRFAFPEARHGMVPGLGGTVRLPRLVGLEVALDLIVQGRSLSAGEAHAIGLVDAVLPAARFGESVHSWIRERLERGRMRNGAGKGVGRRLLEDTAPGRRLVAARAARRLRAPDAPPAGKQALDLVLENLVLPLERAFEREAQVAGELLTTELARGMMHTARGLAAAARGAAEQPRVERVGVVGSGEPAADCVYLLASAGIPTRLHDSSRERLADTTRFALRRLAMDVRDGRISTTDADRGSASITPSTGFGGFGILDAVLVVQGAERALAAALREAEDHTAAECLLCCSAPWATTAELQGASGRSGMVLRFLVPPSARGFPVAEIAAGPATSDQAVERAAALARQLGLTSLRIGDSPGGAVHRLLGAYIGEALHLAAEGIDPAAIDLALEDFGFAVGPIARMKEMGADRARSLLRELGDRVGGRFVPPADPLTTTVATAIEPLRARVLVALINEGAMLLEQRVLGSGQLVDAAAGLGLGFPRPRGGLMRYAEDLGLSEIVDSLDELRDRLGPRFEAAPLLRSAAAAGGALTGHAPLPMI